MVALLPSFDVDVLFATLILKASTARVRTKFVFLGVEQVWI